MKSVKPGRGPSMMSGAMSIAVGLFGVIWTVMALSMGGGLFALFGVVFVAIAIAQAVYNFRNATSQNRYSSFDITDSDEESDPLNERFGAPPPWPAAGEAGDARDAGDAGDAVAFCPYCGNPVAGDFEFCSRCGRQLP